EEARVVCPKILDEERGQRHPAGILVRVAEGQSGRRGICECVHARRDARGAPPPCTTTATTCDDDDNRAGGVCVVCGVAHVPTYPANVSLCATWPHHPPARASDVGAARRSSWSCRPCCASSSPTPAIG